MTHERSLHCVRSIHSKDFTGDRFCRSHCVRPTPECAPPHQRRETDASAACRVSCQVITRPWKERSRSGMRNRPARDPAWPGAKPVVQNTRVARRSGHRGETQSNWPGAKPVAKHALDAGRWGPAQVKTQYLISAKSCLAVATSLSKSGFHMKASRASGTKSTPAAPLMKWKYCP